MYFRPAVAWDPGDVIHVRHSCADIVCMCGHFNAYNEAWGNLGYDVRDDELFDPIFAMTLDTVSNGSETFVRGRG